MAASLQALQYAQQLPYETTINLHTGAVMPALGLGTWELRHHTAATVLQALEAGYRMIDTSADYHTQRGIGEALREFEGEREDVFIVTKIEETDDAFEATRRNLA